MSVLGPNGIALRSQVHDMKLEMLFEWIAQPSILAAIVRQHVAATRDLVRLTALLSTTISTPGAGTDGAEGVTEQTAGELMFLCLDDKDVRREIAMYVADTYGIPWKQAVKELRAMRLELVSRVPDRWTTPTVVQEAGGVH